MKKAVLIFLAAAAAAMPCRAQKAPAEGDWTGKLSFYGHQLTIVFHIKANEFGSLVCTMDSPDQSATNIPAFLNFCSADSISVGVGSIGAAYGGKIMGDSIQGTFSQMGFNIPMTMHRGLEKLNRPQNPKEPYPYMALETSFKNEADSALLCGTLCYPKDFVEGKTPVVIMVSGSGQENRDEEIFDHKPFLVIADYLARNGIASLRYDDRGCGQSKGGDVKNATTADFARDTEAGIEYLRSLGKFGKVGILGHSEGASIAFILGAKGKADFIVSLAGIGVKGDTALTAQANKNLELAGQTKRLTTQQYRVQSMLASSPWLNYFLDYDPTADLKAVKCPVMAINGEKDSQVLPELNLMAINEKLPSDKRHLIRRYPGLNHLFQHCNTGAPSEYRSIEETISPEVLSDITTWIKTLE